MHPEAPVGVLAGRDSELTLLDGLLRDLARGSGNAALIEGEPGIGKTALVRAALANAQVAGGQHSQQGGLQTFWGAGDELGQELPLLPFLEGLQVRGASANARRAAIAGLLRGEVATDRGADVPAMLAEQLIALIIDETAARPVALVIDDLHWADSATVKLWGRLARTAREVPLLLVGLTRPTPAREGLLALRRTVPDENRLQLFPLPQSAVTELVGTLAGGRPDPGLLKLAVGAAGNPLYLTELIAALARSGGITLTSGGAAELAAGNAPDSLPAAIASRLDFVSTPTRVVLRAAALLGVEFAVVDLTTVLGRTVAELVPSLDEARAIGVLADAGGGLGLAFRHPLIREALYAELPTAVRSAWHRDAGQALAAAGAAPDRVARQLLRAVDPKASGESVADHMAGRSHGKEGASAAVTRTERSSASDGTASRMGSPTAGTPGSLTVDIERPPLGFGSTRMTGPVDEWMLDWLTTSADSLVGQAPGVAAELLAQAVDGIPAGSVKHGWLASRLADALYRTGDHAAAEQVATRALTYAADPDLIVDLQWTLAQCRIVAGSAAESLAALEQALAAPGITAKHRARLLVLAARTYLFLGDTQAADREANSALTAATEAADPWATGWAYNVLAGVATVHGNLRSALPLYDRGLEVTETDPALYDLGLLLQVNKAVILCNLDRFDESLAMAQRARQLADQVGTSVRLAQAHAVLSQVFCEMGRWDDALTGIGVVPEDLKDPQVASCDFAVGANICLHRNEPEMARRHLAAAEHHAERAGQRLIPQLLLARSLELEQSGALPHALTILTTTLDSNSADLGEIEDLLGDAVRLALKVDDKATAQTLAGQAATLAEGSTIPHRQANALYCRGMVDRDAAVLLQAAQRYQDAGRPLPRAKALEAAALCLVEADDRTAARQAFELAVEVYEFLGAEADLNRVQAEFRAHGIRRGPHSKHRRAVSGWDSLTDTELKVAAFVEEGLSNPEIAARLMLSRRTVATHVSHILKKLDVATRTDIARESALRVVAAR
jgi:DNA-binding CsgD family transcriptional regulator/tetratricopeptide (TPR) repeat protein